MLDPKNSEPSPKFEVSFVVRDKKGRPTGKRKSFASDDCQGMARFFNKYQGNKGGKGRGTKKGKSN
tara:strand:+ start:34369 stop:34566 length:198 start_codon:yes stop_codon:yes gene_type:complete